METHSQCYPYDKSIVINALYDTIDSLGLCLKSSNSSRGTLIVSDEQHLCRLRIGMNAFEKAGQTQVSVFPEKSVDFFNKWNAVILDELLGTIQRACRGRPGVCNIL